MKRKVAFIDRDGTIIKEPEDFQVDSLAKLALVDGVIPALLALKAAGYELVMVTNQDALGTAAFPQEDFDPPHNLMRQILDSQGANFDAVLIDPSHPDDRAPTRKPAIGLVLPYLQRGDLDFERSFVVGDRETDRQFADNIGIRSYLLGDDWSWPQIVREQLDAPRRASEHRKTNETDIRVEVDLDATQPIAVATGIGFFDHMLEQLGKHGGFSLTLKCEGDLHIDEHHTVEDCALALGAALRQALGDKRGIGRYGFVLPMDEAQARVAIDLSGRPHCRFNVPFRSDAIGELSTQMIEHFFRSLADALRAAIHIDVDGDNDHHLAEATFKGVAKSLGQAFARDGGMELPSTKGML